MNIIMNFVLSGIIFFSISTVSAYANLSEGLAAYQRKDYAVAYKEFLTEAKQGHAQAQSYLGVMYSNGWGVAQDYPIAYMWFSWAGTNGNTVAIKNKDIVAKLMTPEQIAKAQNMVSDGMAKYRADKCTINVQDKVKFENPSVLYKKIKNIPLKKREFETSSEYEKRKAEVFSKTNPKKPVLLKAFYDSNRVEYNADKEQFAIQTYAWDNLPIEWGLILGFENKKWVPIFDYVNKYGYKPGYLLMGGSTDFAVGLSSIDDYVGTYEASNAFGAKVEVVKYKRTVYGVFDKSIEGSDREEWMSEIMVGKYNSTPAVRLNIPRDKAKLIKKNMQVGILVRPREPFTVKGRGYFSPKINVPKEIDTTYNIFIADIMCAIITDGDGTVLKTVNRAP